MMKQLKQASALFLCLLLFSSCSNQVIGEQQAFNPNLTVEESKETAQISKIETLKLPANYADIAASPWSCADLNNRKEAMLLFDSPVTLSPNFQAEPALVAVSGSGVDWVLTVQPERYFSDGSALTARDIDNSLSMALEETSYYKNRLSNIKSHTVSGDTVKITLNQPDALFANLLTFPVAKQSGGEYIGTGKYVFDSKEGDSVTLTQNPSYWGKKPSVPAISLVSLPKEDIAAYSLKLGEIDCLYTEGAAEDARNLSAGDYPVISNQLVFLGVNMNRENGKNASVRKAISLALDRKYLIQSSFSASAVPAASVLHPNFMEKQTSVQRNLDTAKKLLAESGFSQSEPLSLTLLYCTDGADRAQTANQIAAQLAEAGIRISLDGKPEKEYFSALASGNYDLYLGEILLGDDMNFSHLFTKGDRYGYGVVPSEALMNAYQTAFSTENGWDAFLKAFEAEYPIVPLAFRNATLSFSRKYSVNVTATASNLFYNIDSWQ